MRLYADVRLHPFVLMVQQISSSFLSDPKSLQRVYGIVEQLYEDLNSYCESFVALPVLPHTLYGIGERRGMKTAPDFSGDPRRTSRLSSRGAGGGLSSDPVLTPSDYRSLSASLASLVKGMPSSATVRAAGPAAGGVSGGGRTGSSDSGSDVHARPSHYRSSTANSSSGHSDGNRIRADSGALASVPPSVLTPIIEPAPMMAKRRTSYFDDESVSPTTILGDRFPGGGSGAGGMVGIKTGAARPSISRATTVTTVTAVSDATASGRKVSTDTSSSEGLADSIAESSKGSTTSGSTPSSREALKRNLSSSAVPGILEEILTTSSPTAEVVKQPWERDTPRSAATSGRNSLSAAGVEEAERSRDGLQESLLALAKLAEAHAAGTNGDDAAEMEMPGRREPPHGLGRTVRDAINVKLFPTYPNPTPALDWDVPVALLDLQHRIDSAWDLTMAKIIPFIDGVCHVKRIAQLADADLDLTRQCMDHLVYYGCIIMIDVFQFSNMYSVRPIMSRMAEDEGLWQECIAYVTRPGFAFPDYPKILHLYSTLRPGKTVSNWIEEHDVDQIGIDPRRFITFGVIKGFLRRLHRYPVLTTPTFAYHEDPRSALDLRTGDQSPTTLEDQFDSAGERSRSRHRSENSIGGDGPPSLRLSASPSNRFSNLRSVSGKNHPSPHHHHHHHVRTSKRNTTATVLDVASAALDALRAEDEDKFEESPWLERGASTINRSGWNFTDSSAWSRSTIRKRPSTASLAHTQSGFQKTPGTVAGGGGTGGGAGVSGFSKLSDEMRNRLPVPDELASLLDGTVHDDHLCVRFGVSFADLEGWFQRIGGIGSGPRGPSLYPGGGAGQHVQSDDRWEDETPMMSGFVRTSSGLNESGFARLTSRGVRAGQDQQQSRSQSGFVQSWLDPLDGNDVRARSRSRERGDYGNVKIILM